MAIGDNILKVYGSNLFMYEEDKGWVVPEIAPDPDYNPPYKPPSTDPEELEVIKDIQWTTGEIDPSLPPTEELVVKTARYTTQWIKVKPDAWYAISSKFTNTFALQYKNGAGVIRNVKVPNSVTDANTAIRTGLDTAWVRFYFYVGYEVLHELSMRQFLEADPEQIPPIRISDVEVGYVDGNKEALQNDYLALYLSTGWVDVKPNTTYLTFFSASNRYYMQFKGKEEHWYTGNITYKITLETRANSSASNKLFTTKADTVQVRIWFAEDMNLGGGGGIVMELQEQVPRKEESGEWNTGS